MGLDDIARLDAEHSFGPIEQFMTDPFVSEIMINGPQKVFIEKHGKKQKTDVSFQSEDDVMKLVEAVYKVRGKRVGQDIPYADVCLADGTRINVIIWPVSRFGLSVTIRKFSQDIQTLEDLIKLETLHEKAAELLIAAVKGKINIVFSGGTATGKTTLLQVLSTFLDPYERVITIEDAAELNIQRDNVISLETKSPDEQGRGAVTLRDLLANSLRMAPDRLIVGEVRGAEAVDLLQAMAVGHAGTLAVVHGSSPRDVLGRLETMVLMSGIELPIGEVRKLVCSTIQLIVHLERMVDGSRKVTYISEVRGMDQGDYDLNDLFKFNFDRIDKTTGKVKGALRSSLRYYPAFFQKLQKLGYLSDKVFVSG
ncbi:MAG: Flp pilus assembly complex ATPase component TadA [Candidatus Omnitrophica bacterium]|nr:Flp pilus assembly complex ATPase component TadA [Candidatus Omnitrophota bacterium]